MKQNLTKVFILLLALLLTACSNPAPAAEENDLEATLSAVQTQLDTVLAEQTALDQQTETLQNEKDTLQELVTDLDQQINTLSEEIHTANSEKETLIAENLALTEKTQQLVDLFLSNENDLQGEFVLCGNAFDLDFGYVDNLAMRKELAQYEADLTGTSAVNIETRHEKIWINRDDGMVWVLVKGLWYPFLVRYDDETFASKNSVYSLTSGCYLDFPAMEQALLAIGID